MAKRMYNPCMVKTKQFQPVRIRYLFRARLGTRRRLVLDTKSFPVIEYASILGALVYKWDQVTALK